MDLGGNGKDADSKGDGDRSEYRLQIQNVAEWKEARREKKENQQTRKICPLFLKKAESPKEKEEKKGVAANRRTKSTVRE